jgi:hypothetical protein
MPTATEYVSSMTSPRLLGHAATLVVTVSLLAAAGCGSSDSADDSTDPVATAAAATDTADGAVASDEVSPDEPAVDTVATEPAETPVVTEATPETSAAPAEDGGSSGGVQVTLSDGRAWTLQKDLCTFDPDATGPAAAIINIGGANDDGVEVNIIEAWPFDGSTDKGTPFLGSFVDEDEEVLVFLKDGAAMVGDEVEVAGGYYANVFYQDGDAFDGTYTVRCQP